MKAAAFLILTTVVLNILFFTIASIVKKGAERDKKAHADIRSHTTTGVLPNRTTSWHHHRNA